MPIRVLMGLILGVSMILMMNSGTSQIRKPSLEQRTLALEDELRRLQILQASMGERHPKREELEKRMAQLNSELEQLRSAPNPFQDLTEEREANRALVEQMSDEELRALVIRLATEVKLLQARVARLEEQQLR